MSLRRLVDLSIYAADCQCGAVKLLVDTSHMAARDAFVAEGWEFPPVEGGVARSVCPVCVGVVA